ncbi:MAG: type II toxin-antitoxin system prevent-host-death family antitoxin [Mesorhizobium sp.]|nr:type II toxin-antitoxin system prevent-host-death family antitoxin [Mesorhizobium sp.]MCO5161935.1 type II toxin-antitoxin system prevent-host-death family antitoxin [Mesorhizobium sp.]
MNKIVTAAEANRDFSKLLRSVKDGDTVVVTSHGTPIAKIIPIENDTERREEAKQRYLNELRNRPVLNLPRWTRDELYDD